MSRNFFAIFYQLYCIFGPDPASYAGHILYYGALEWGLLRGARTGDLEDTFSEGTALQPVQRPGRIKAGNLH